MRPITHLHLLLAACIVVGGCEERAAQRGPTKLTSANYEQIFDGMSYAGVEYLLGTDSKVTAALDPAELLPGRHDTAEEREWQDGERRVTVDFVNGRVVSKQAAGL
jgi:hypothetical protein